MDARVSQLETHMDYMRESVSDIRASQRDATKAISELASKLSELATKVETLPTKDDLWSWKVQWLAIALAAVAFIVGGIFGGLDWIKTH
jgi:outer membrane murein-binding lipoprotein Lpp